MHEDEPHDDSQLFREAMRDVRPLDHGRTAPARAPRPAPVPRQRQADDRAVLQELGSARPGELDDLGPERGEALSYLKSGLQRRILRKLRRGHYSIGAELDLHGMTVPVAKGALSEFLAHCRRRNHRCVRIVHGKGRRSSNSGPVLKAKVDRWLRRRDDVLAFCSARPMDGGTGALYVLLDHS